MKRLINKLLMFVIVLVCVVTLTACTSKKDVKYYYAQIMGILILPLQQILKMKLTLYLRFLHMDISLLVGIMILTLKLELHYLLNLKKTQSYMVVGIHMLLMN